jgi:uncharacterized protein YutE (UPF0331/DUF86 family)
MRKMMGFRNVLVHEYKHLDIQLMVDVVEHHLDDLLAYGRAVMRHFGA